MPPHCDSMDGPVVKAAARALAAENADLVLPFVPKEGESEVREVFGKVIRLRKESPQAKELSDRFFFETVVRIHRAGEGAPYTGLKPAGLSMGPVIPVAERAIETGSPDQLVKILSEAVAAEVLTRFAHVMGLKAEADGDLDANRKYVAALLGLEVWSNFLYEAVKASPHGEHHDAHGH